MDYSLSLDFFVQATPDEVMELLTNPDFIRDWSGEESLIEKFVGGKFVLFDGWVEGKVLKITTDELAYTWKPSNWPESMQSSEVHFKLEPANHGTEVYVTHTNLPNKEEFENYKLGWDKNFFALIGEYLANRNL